MQPATFNKRIYSLPAFREAVREIISHFDELRAAFRAGRIGKAFAEKIMLAVTQVNGCRYCSYGHSRAALAAGVSEAELQQLLQGEIGGFPEQEAVALAFAQHYAESGCQPAPASVQRLVDYYGDETARDIRAYLRMITFGNLLGNTFDALLSRLKGKPAPGSRLRDELGVVLGVFFVMPFQMLKRSLVKG
ncbi:MAG: carboxymuconolactone decarboxylase family protein [Anaerolineales bacterium]|jgi:AhpD family alkylhydroperoxidase|nr:carboxymuconolactone decarboxylase family protein [Anaerolineales bacterium]